MDDQHAESRKKTVRSSPQGPSNSEGENTDQKWRPPLWMIILAAAILIAFLSLALGEGPRISIGIPALLAMIAFMISLFFKVARKETALTERIAIAICLAAAIGSLFLPEAQDLNLRTGRLSVLSGNGISSSTAGTLGTPL